MATNAGLRIAQRGKDALGAKCSQTVQGTESMQAGLGPEVRFRHRFEESARRAVLPPDQHLLSQIALRAVGTNQSGHETSGIDQVKPGDPSRLAILGVDAV